MGSERAQPEKFGRYLLLEKVAIGGMAEVFLAKAISQVGISKFVALKRMLPKYSSNPEFMKMFLDEARITMNLNHSNIVSIHEFGVEEGQFFLVMDFVEGVNLKTLNNLIYKNKMRLNLEQILYIARETCRGLHYAHTATDPATGELLNIIHRDITPHNIMITFEGEVKIIDFGIAKAESRLENTEAGVFKGKITYFSPEQADGKPIGPQTDIYTLGVVMWEQFTQTRLFGGKSKIEVLNKVLEGRIPPIKEFNPNVPSEVEAIVLKALAREPHQRFKTAAEFETELSIYLQRYFPSYTPQVFSQEIKLLFRQDLQRSRQRKVEYSAMATEVTRKLQISWEGKDLVQQSRNTSFRNRFNLSRLTSNANTVTVMLMLTSALLGALITRLFFVREVVIVQNSAPPPAAPLPAPAPEVVANEEALPPAPQETQELNPTPEPVTELPPKIAQPEPSRFQEMPQPKEVVRTLPPTNRPKALAKKPSAKPKKTVEAQKPRNRFVDLDPERTLQITSRPTGAQIWVNGENSGLKTPASIRVPANQTAQIVLRKKGFADEILLTDKGTKPLTIQSQLRTALPNQRVSTGESGTITLKKRKPSSSGSK